MTAQISDSFRYQDRDFGIVGISDHGSWFNPSHLNLKPEPPNTACWRGYFAHFGVSSSHLFLEQLHIFLMGEGYTPIVGPNINGVNPTGSSKEIDWFNNHYLELAYPLNYTGSLLLGDGFIHELYVHMGVQSSWKFERVFELVFKEGLLMEEYDRSEQMAEIRKVNIQRKFEAGGPKHLHRWPDDTIMF